MSRAEMMGRRCQRRVVSFVALAMASAATAGAQTPTPTFSKVFSPGTIAPGSVSTLTFSITNNGGSPATELAFTDNLPAGVTIASPARAGSNCLGVGGTLSAPDGGTTISLVDGSLGGFASCTVSVDVTSSTVGTHMNVSGDLTSSAGNSGPAAADLTVGTDRPGFTKTFSPPSVDLGERSTLTFTIDNTLNAAAAALLSFTDALPTGMVVADPSAASTTCTGGIVTAVPGSGSVSFSSGSVAAGASCTVAIDVVATGAGALGNTTGELTSVFGFTTLSSGRAAAVLAVSVGPVHLVKAFTDDPVPPGGTATLEFIISNFDRSFSATGVAFTDDLTTLVPPLAGLTFGSLLSNDCGGSVSGVGGTTLDLTGGTVAPEGSCTLRVSLAVPPGATPGAYANTTSTVAATVDGSPVVGNAASDDLHVGATPSFTKEFIDDPTTGGGTVTLRFTITNTDPASALTGIAFSDDIGGVPPPDSRGGAIPGLAANGLVAASGLDPEPFVDPCGAGSLLTIPDPNDTNPSPPFPNLPPDPTLLNFTGGSLAAAGMPGDSCSFDVTLDVPVGIPSGAYLNTTSDLTATPVGTSGASDSVIVVAAPLLRKEFTDDPVPPGGTVTLEFTLSHPPEAIGDATGITFTDGLDALGIAGLTANLPPSPDPPCGAGSSLTAPGNVLTLLNGSLMPGEDCTFSVTLDVPALAAPGGYTNTTSGVGATVGGLAVTSAAASDVLKVAGLVFTKEFLDDPVAAGDTVTLRFTVENTHPTDAATGIGFSDDLAAVLPGTPDLTATLPPTTDTCGGAMGGPTLLSYAGGSVTAGATCTIDLEVLVPAGTADGTYLNKTGTLTATQGGVVLVDPAADELTVQALLPPVFAKAFAPSAIAPGGVSTLTFTIDNTAEATAATDLDFTDNLPAGMTVAATPNASTTCTGGTLTATAGTGVITYTGGTVAGGATCTVSVDVTASAFGAYTNTTGDLTSTLDGGASGNSGAATATLNAGAIGLSKQFVGDPVVAGKSVTLQFTVTNDNATPATDITFTDDLDAVVPGLVATGLPASDVCGAGSQLSGAGVLTFTGGLLGPGASCDFSVTLQVPIATAVGSYPNTTSVVAARVSGFTLNGSPATDLLDVLGAPALSIDDVSAAEGDSGTTLFRFTVTLSPAAADTITVDFGTANGTATQGADYNAASGTLTFAAGETSKTVDVQVVGELLFEPDETFFVDLTNPSGALLADPQGQGTIQNDEVVPSLSIDDVTLPEGDAGTTAFDFTVTLSAPSADAVSVDYATADGTALSGSDYAATSGTLNFAALETSKTITVQVLGELLAEPSEDFFVNLSSPLNATIGDGQGLGTILGGDVRTDFNNDGKPDILWQNSSGPVSVWYMDGPNRLDGGPLSPGEVVPAWRLAASADFNSDGKPDVLWQHQTGVLWVWYMNGASRVTGDPLGPGAVDPSWRLAASADFNSDGKPDVLWQNESTGALAVWYMDGVTRTSGGPLSPGEVAPEWRAAAAGDLNADGKPDIVWQHTNGSLAVWFMDGANRVDGGPLSPGTADPRWKVAGAEDFDFDGKADILWQRDDGRLAVWFMDGANRVGGAPLSPNSVSPGWRLAAPR